MKLPRKHLKSGFIVPESNNPTQAWGKKASCFVLLIRAAEDAAIKCRFTSRRRFCSTQKMFRLLKQTGSGVFYLRARLTWRLGSGRGFSGRQEEERSAKEDQKPGNTAKIKADEVTQFGFQMLHLCWTSLDPNIRVKHLHRPLVDGCSSQINRFSLPPYELWPPRRSPQDYITNPRRSGVFGTGRLHPPLSSRRPLPACVLSVSAGAPARCDSILVSNGSWS